MIEHDAYFPEVLQVVPLDGYRILVYFDDGTIHRYDVEPLLDQSVFAPLRDVKLFRSTLTVMGGTVAWDLRGDRDESACIDLDPLALYRETPEVEEPAWLREPARQA
jgi:hypothetical protein